MWSCKLVCLDQHGLHRTGVPVCVAKYDRSISGKVFRVLKAMFIVFGPFEGRAFFKPLAHKKCLVKHARFVIRKFIKEIRTMTKKLLDLVTLVGDFIAVIVVIPLLLGLCPSWLILCPKNSIPRAKNTF